MEEAPVVSGFPGWDKAFLSDSLTGWGPALVLSVGSSETGHCTDVPAPSWLPSCPFHGKINTPPCQQLTGCIPKARTCCTGVKFGLSETLKKEQLIYQLLSSTLDSKWL